MRRQAINAVLGLGAYLFLAMAPGFAAEYTCSDSACIKTRLANALPGDRILIAPGDYLGLKMPTNYNRAAFFYSNRSGTATQPITLEALDPDDKPVLHGTGATDAYIVHLLNASYWTIRNIVFHSASKGLILDNVHNTTLTGLEVYNTGDEGVHFRDGSSGNVIMDSYIHDTGVTSPGFGEGVYIGSADGTLRPDGSQYNQAANNNLVSGVRFGPNVRGEHVDVKERTQGSLIENCVFDATGMANANSVDSVVNVKGNQTLVRNNTVYRKGNPNLLYAFKVYTVYSAGVLSGRNNSFVNNTLHLDTAQPYVMYVQAGVAAKVSNNERQPVGNMYLGITKDITPPLVPAPGGQGVIAPSGDATVRGGSSASTNYGLDPLLVLKTDSSADGTRMPFLRFSLAHLQAISSAKLRLYIKPSAKTTMSVHASPSLWDEEALTWNNKPAYGAVLGSVDLSAVGFYEVDLTAYAKAQLGSGKQLSVALRDSRGKYTEIHSWENAVNPPQLIISVPKVVGDRGYKI